MKIKGKVKVTVLGVNLTKKGDKEYYVVNDGTFRNGMIFPSDGQSCDKSLIGKVIDMNVEISSDFGQIAF